MIRNLREIGEERNVTTYGKQLHLANFPPEDLATTYFTILSIFLLEVTDLSKRGKG